MKKTIIVFLCLSLMASCFFFPVHAIDPVIGFTAAQSVLFTLIFDFVEWSTLEGVPAVLDGITDLLAPAGRIWLDSFEYQGARMVLTEEARADIFAAVLNGITKMDKLIHPKNKDIEDLTEEDIGFVGDTIVSMTDAEIYSYLSQYFDIQEDIVDLEQNLASTNGILSGISGQMQNIFGSVESFSEDFADRIGHLQTTVSTIRVNLVNDLGEISVRINGLTQSVVSKLQTVLNVLDSSINDVKIVAQAIKVEVVDGFADLRSEIKSLTSSFSSKLQTVSNVLDSSINDVLLATQAVKKQVVDGFASVENLISGSIQVLKTDIGDNLVSIKQKVYDIWWSLCHNIQNGVISIEADVNDTLATLEDHIVVPIENMCLNIDTIAVAITDYFSPKDLDDDEDNKSVIAGGINSGLFYLGRSNGILSKYAAGFLAATSIFNLFADLPVLSDLITISISIGLVGAFLGMALNVSKSDAVGRREKVGAD